MTQYAQKKVVPPVCMTQYAQKKTDLRSSDFYKNWYPGVFEVAESEYDIIFSKFKWRIQYGYLKFGKILISYLNSATSKTMSVFITI